MSIDPFLSLAKLIVDARRRFRIRFNPTSLALELEYVTPLARQSIDERLTKIDAARQNLSEALDAMDSLKETAEENRRDLERLLKAVADAEFQKENVDAELRALKGISELESGAVRRALKMPTTVTIWRERLIAFTFGIAASITAAFIWEQFLKNP